ncbi:cytochrome c oxidase subunit II [Ponticoccus alexandrii]|uniref:cytochrome c oxidase subunit II n=1 Tax=Ponticoccus alexandrii TaxID=1943633 RepID=UPI00203EF96A|nr:cytochrome c oxidase subunit II [Ponticoccus alexandrii]
MNVRRFPFPKAESSLWLAAVLIALPNWASAADLFSPIGPVMEDQSTHFLRSAVIALVAVLPAIIALPILLWRYRYGSAARYAPDWEFNKWYESAIWGVPVLVICVLAFWLTQSTVRFDPYTPLGEDPLEINLVGLDFRYLALYPDQRVAALDQIVIPVGRPVTFRLTTDTVMQSFLPNGFAGQIYAMPGMITKLNLAANREGEGQAIQTQFNGYGFANMRVPMRAVSEAAFAAWVDGAKGDPLDAHGYAGLVVAGASAQEYHQSTPELRPLGDTCLFDRVVARYHQGTAVPPEAQPGSTAYDPAKGALPSGDCDTLLSESAPGVRRMTMTHDHSPSGSDQ